MSRHAGSFTAGVLAGAIGLAGSLSLAMAQGASPPDFAPNPSAGWFAYNREFIPPASGPGPVVNDPAHPHVSNDEFRATGKQPTTSVADLDNPILQPWAREKIRERNATRPRRKAGVLPACELLADGRSRVPARADDAGRCTSSRGRRKW